MFPERPWTRTAPPPACTSCCATLMAAWPGPLYPLGAWRSSWESGGFQGASYNLPADSSWLLSPVLVMVTSLPGTGGQGQVHPPRPKRGLVCPVGLGLLAPMTWCRSWRRCILPDPLRASVPWLWEGMVGSPSRPTLCCRVTFCTWPCLIVGLPRDRGHSQGCRATCRS